MERGREVGRESTEEVEGRLASIRERDADRVGESWVRSHKEVDTRRHLNPPCPPSRTSSPELRPYSSAQSPRRLPIANHRSRPPSPCLSLIVLSLCFAHSRSVRLAPGIYCASFSLSLPPSVAILSLYWRSLRASLPTLAKGNPPQKQKREAKAARGSSRVVGGFFCYCRQMLYLVKRGEERRGGEIEGERKKVVSGGWWSGAAAGRLAARKGREVRSGRSEEVERGKSSARSTIFPSRRAVTFYLASFGECSDSGASEKKFRFSYAVKVTSVSARARLHTPYFSCGYF